MAFASFMSDASYIVMSGRMSSPLTWTKLMPCQGCELARECFACADGWRCARCRPKDWTPPPAEEWLRSNGGWRPFRRYKQRPKAQPVTDVSPSDDDESETDASRRYEKYR